MKRVQFGSMALVAIALVGCGKREEVVAEKPYTVTKGDVSVSIIESGTVDAIRSVEVKPQITGRISKLLVDEGDQVVEGQLLAVIDPQETRLSYDQTNSQLVGAEAGVARSTIEIAQRKKTAAVALAQAEARVTQLELEVKNTPALLKAEIASAEANLRSAEADRDRIKNSTQPTQIAATKATLQEAEQNLRNSKFEYERQVELEKQGYSALRNVQNAQLNVQLAQTRLENARVAMNRQEAGLEADMKRANEAVAAAETTVRRAKTNLYTVASKRAELDSARAEVLRARAGLSDPALLEKSRQQGEASVAQLRSALQESARKLNETSIKSPLTGTISKKLLQIGEMASGLSSFSAGSTIFKIEDRTKMRVKLAVNEIDIAKLSVGMPAEVAVDAVPNEKISGKISKMAPARQLVNGAEVQVGTDAVVKYEVEIVLDKTVPALRSGMSAKCTMNVASSKNVVFLPVEYVEKKEDEFFVYFPGAAVKKGEVAKPTKQKIKVGVISNSRYEVLSGVKAGDSVVKPTFSGPPRKGFMQMGPDDGGDDAAAKDSNK
ncbi:MAG: efflux RND transporter periplasmic adaptor subunit [Fimbriimonas sp.]|nr:efflux RND transporter periplasmic adaptor subunit [Fimbriimonas sp.]